MTTLPLPERMNIIDERVDAGVEFLDERDADWRSRVNTNLLDMRDASLCVLGQVFSSETMQHARDALYATGFRYALAEHSGCGAWSDGAMEWAIERGFNVDAVDADDDITYADLESAWLTRIAERDDVH